MSFTVTKYPAGTICWVDIYSNHPGETKEFFAKLMGWTYEDNQTPDGSTYTLFSKDGQVVTELSGMPIEMGDMPSFWNTFVAVDNVDETLAKAKELGAQVCVEPTDVMDAGRMAGVNDPTGAPIMFWQANKFIGASLVNTIGAMGWNELYTTDAKKAKEFYSKLFGWEFEGDDTGYYIIKNNGRMNGGMLEIQPQWGEMPPHWLVYFTVEDLDKAIKVVTESGGQIQGDVVVNPEIGKFARISEPTGASNMIIQLSTEPDKWEE